MASAKDFRFTLSPEVRELGVRGAYVVISGMKNARGDREFEAYKAAQGEALKARYTAEFIKADPILQGFRDLHDKIGRSNRKYPASPEALIGLLQRIGRLPAVNLAVDIYNFISVESRLSMGAHDIAKIDGDVHMKLVDGTERFIPLGRTKLEPVEAGEYCYVDDAGDVLCRLEYRQTDKTKITEDSTDCFYILQGNANTSSDYIESVMGRLIELIEEYCGGEERILTAGQ